MQALWSSPCNFDSSGEGCPPTLAGVPVQSSLCLALWLTLPFGHVRCRAIGIVPVGLYWPSRIALPSTTAVRMHDSSPLCPQRTHCPRATRPLPAASDGPHRPVLPRRPPTARRPGESTPAQPELCALSKRTSTKNSGRHPPKCSRYFFFRKHWHQFSAVQSQVFWSTLESLQLLPAPPDYSGNWHAATVAEHSNRLHTLRLLDLEVLDGGWDTPLLYAVSCRLSYPAPP